MTEPKAPDPEPFEDVVYELLEGLTDIHMRLAETLDDHARRVEQAAHEMTSAASQMREAAGTMMMASRR